MIFFIVYTCIFLIKAMLQVLLKMALVSTHNIFDRKNELNTHVGVIPLISVSKITDLSRSYAHKAIRNSICNFSRDLNLNIGSVIFITIVLR